MNRRPQDKARESGPHAFWRRTRRRLVVSTYRGMRVGKRRIPPGLRLIVGLLLICGGLLGFLPILGFWMIPLGIAIASLDIPPLYSALNARLRKLRYRRGAARNLDNERNQA